MGQDLVDEVCSGIQRLAEVGRGVSSATGRPLIVMVICSPVATRSSSERVWFLSSREATVSMRRS